MSSCIKSTIIRLKQDGVLGEKKYVIFEILVVNKHSNLKFRVFATEAFRFEKSIETFDNSTEVSGEINEKFESVSISPKFRFW
jgi:hypothetical protein